MISVTLTDDELVLLTDHYKHAGCHLIRQRAHTAILSHKGYTPPQIADILERSDITIVREWLGSFATTRISSIFHRYDGNTNSDKFTKEQREEIKLVVSKPPTDKDLPKEFWTLPLVKDYISAEFGIVYESPRSYHYLLQFGNLSFKQPSPFNNKRDEMLIQKRMKEISNELKPFWNNEEYVILSSDECRLVHELEIRRAWIEKGKKTIIKATKDQSKHQHYFGALNMKSGKHHLIELPWQNEDEIIKALKTIVKKYPNKHIVMIWDNATWHKSKKIREELKKGKSLENLHLINFPPYAPENNPEEHVWRVGKDAVANQSFTTFSEMKEVFKKAVTSRKFHYKVSGFVLR